MFNELEELYKVVVNEWVESRKMGGTVWFNEWSELGDWVNVWKREGGVDGKEGGALWFNEWMDLCG